LKWAKAVSVPIKMKQMFEKSLKKHEKFYDFFEKKDCILFS